MRELDTNPDEAFKDIPSGRVAPEFRTEKL
jgi:hypothetical protein